MKGFWNWNNGQKKMAMSPIFEASHLYSGFFIFILITPFFIGG